MRIRSDQIHIKKDLLKQLKQEGTFFKKQNKRIYLDMMQAIDEYRMLQNYKDVKPDFSCIHAADVDNLNYEICQTVHRFGDIEFFKPFDRNFWLEFLDIMERRVYLAGDGFTMRVPRLIILML